MPLVKLLKKSIFKSAKGVMKKDKINIINIEIDALQDILTHRCKFMLQLIKSMHQINNGSDVLKSIRSKILRCRVCKLAERRNNILPNSQNCRNIILILMNSAKKHANNASG